VRGPIPGWLVMALTLTLGLAPPLAPLARADAPGTLVVDWPDDGAVVGGGLVLSGWAAASTVDRGTGVDGVRAYLDGPAGDGRLLGTATYGLTRPDVALALREARYGASGWQLDAELPPGPHALFVYAHLADQPDDAGWIGPVQLALRVTGGSASTAAAGSERPMASVAAAAAGERAPAPAATAPAASACAGRQGTAAACAASRGPISPNQCLVPDRDSGRCLVRAGSANARGPSPAVPGSWTAADLSGASASSGTATSAGSPARPGYSVASGGAGDDRPPSDAGSAGATAPAPGSASSAATSASRPGGPALSLSAASMGGQQVQLNWNAYTAGQPVTYEVRRCPMLTSASSACGLVATVQGGGYRLMQADGVYFVRALGPDGQPEGESNRVQLCCRG